MGLTLRENDIERLERVAKSIRRRVIETIGHAQAGHPGGSLSSVDILTCLFFQVMRINPHKPDWEDRDRFVLSKGHAAAALYSTLAERGFFSPEILPTFGKINSLLQVHPDMHKVKGVEISTGALGQGFSVALGIALGAKLDGKDISVYALVGDGESQEGQVWEAAMCAAHYKLDNLTVLLDYNKAQLLGPVSEIMEVAPLAEKWRAFGWHTSEIDGHDIKQIIEALASSKEIRGKPVVIIAHTTKGKGVSFMEGPVGTWHGKPPSEEEMKKALEELK